MVIQPSILSKFDQMLLIGLIPSKSATRAIKAKAVTDIVTQLNLGAYCLSLHIKTSQRAKTISTTILKTKAFPPMNGKNNPSATYRGINGTMNKPVIIEYLNIFVAVF
jgi:hypothetical protein